MSCAGALPDSIIMQRSLKHWQLASSQGRFKCPNRETSEKEGRSKKKNAPRYFGGTSSSVPPVRVAGGGFHCGELSQASKAPAQLIHSVLS